MNNKIKQFDDLIEIHLRLAEFTYGGIRELFREIGYIHDDQSEFDFVVAWFGTHHVKITRRIDNDETVYYRIED